MSIYIIEVNEDGEQFQYEYGNMEHAEEAYNNETSATMYEYKEGQYYFIKAK
jgi:hypothetical protein